MVSTLDCYGGGVFIESRMLPLLKHMWGTVTGYHAAGKRSVGVTPEVNLREHTSCRPLPIVNKADHSGFETQRRRHQKSKTGVSVAP